MRLFIILAILGIKLVPFAIASGPAVPTALIVDKKSNTLQLCKYQNGTCQIVKTYRATLGRVKGDKEMEGDLKTPEGIYIFQNQMRAPALKPKFGKMAFYMNYPNAFDQLAGRTGRDIMLHATNEPERLKKDYDSEGCVVVRNEDIEEIEPNIRLGLTPILIFSELTNESLRNGQNSKLQTFFEGWVKAWENKDIEKYINYYHSDFSFDGKNRLAWKAYKTSLNSRYLTIQVNPENVQFYFHPKYSMISFVQNYRSTLKGGGVGHRSRGTKTLYVAEEAGEPKLIAETFSTLVF